MRNFESWWAETGEQLTKHEIGLKDLMQCAYEAKPAQHQGEPVCAQIRFRRPEKGCPDWGDWHDLKLCRFDENKTHYIDNVGWECETRAIYAKQPAPVAVMRAALGQSQTDLQEGRTVSVEQLRDNLAAKFIGKKP